jgi:hypothetical protein
MKQTNFKLSKYLTIIIVFLVFILSDYTQSKKESLISSDSFSLIDFYAIHFLDSLACYLEFRNSFNYLKISFNHHSKALPHNYLKYLGNLVSSNEHCI